MSLDNIKLSQRARDQLVTIKRHTKIPQWNIVCRWAFCLSLAEPSPPRDEKIPADSSVEMTWRTFAGENEGVYLALLKQDCHEHDIPLDDASLLRRLRLHLHRGIGYLKGDPHVKSIEGLISKAIPVEVNGDG